MTEWPWLETKGYGLLEHYSVGASRFSVSQCIVVQGYKKLAGEADEQFAVDEVARAICLSTCRYLCPRCLFKYLQLLTTGMCQSAAQNELCALSAPLMGEQRLYILFPIRDICIRPNVYVSSTHDRRCSPAISLPSLYNKLILIFPNDFENSYDTFLPSSPHFKFN